MKIAVMMVAFNAELYIADALASLLRQRADANLDIIVVDDGSTDGTATIVKKLAAEAPEIRLIQTPNRGISAARNAALGALAPDTTLMTSVDSDDLSPAGRFARDSRHFVADPALDLHYGRTRCFRSTDETGLAPSADGPFVDLRGVQLGAALIRFGLIGATGKFNEQMQQAEDADYLLRMFDLSPKIVVVDEICLYYRRHPTNITRDRQTVRRSLARALFEHARRRRTGGAPVPAGFFESQASLREIDWW